MALPRALRLTAATAGLATLGYSSIVTAKAEELPRAADKSVSTLWVAPTRKDVLRALKDSRALPAEQSEAASARFSGLAKEVKGKSADRGSDDEGYDLLIIGGGATGAGYVHSSGL